VKLRSLLAPLSPVYAAIADIRVWGYRKGILRRQRLNKPVISVGNLTAGGTGKTPTVLWIAEKLIQEGQHVAILTRGYKGRSLRAFEGGESWTTSTKGIQSDEAMLLGGRLGQNARIGVGADRYANGRKLESWADCFVLDDGFQHLQLSRDVNVLLIDFTDPFGGGQLLPAGNLREPKSGLARADVVVITRTNHAPALESVIRRYTAAPIFYETTRMRDGLMAFRRSNAGPHGSSLNESEFFAFCGIGNPRAFFADLRLWGFKVVGEAAFRDHHRFSQEDADYIERKAKSAGAEALVCTEKDIFNLSDVQFRLLPVYFCPIELELNDADGFWRAVKSRLSGNAKANAA
jgi:tetraacyldisaccharide 4'-kinase